MNTFCVLPENTSICLYEFFGGQVQSVFLRHEFLFDYESADSIGLDGKSFGDFRVQYCSVSPGIAYFAFFIRVPLMDAVVWRPMVSYTRSRIFSLLLLMAEIARFSSLNCRNVPYGSLSATVLAG